jgi:mono/diheme cytochrome c family protein
MLTHPHTLLPNSHGQCQSFLPRVRTKRYLEKVKTPVRPWLLPAALLLLAALATWDLVAAEAPAAVKKRQARMEKLYDAMNDSLTRFKKPNLANGKKQFLDNCFACHGEDGRRVDFDRTPTAVRYLGTTANNDIELFWAMVNFGDNTRGMGSFEEEIPLQDLLDIAAYVRTLPVK